MKSWRTTSIGGIAAVLFVGYKMYKGQSVEFNDIVMALGLLGLGAASKDSSVHSTEADVEKATVNALDKAVPPGESQ